MSEDHAPIPTEDELYLAQWDAEVAERAAQDGEHWQDPADELWHARPILHHIYTYARAKWASPWSTLGAVLANVVAAVPPWVVLPGDVGDYASLNLFVAVVAPPGGGKGVSEKAAYRLLEIPDEMRAQKLAVGSGEGIAHSYMRRERDGTLTQHTTSVLFSVPEIDTLMKLGKDRNSSTLLEQLRIAYSGEDLGATYADPAKRLPVVAHTYRLCLVMGAQPRRSARLLEDWEGGTPQRFLWLPATDPTAPKPGTEPAVPPAWRWTPPQWPMGNEHGLVVMALPAEAHEAAKWSRWNALNGRVVPSMSESIRAHSVLTKIKVAAALALLDSRAHVSDEDWAIAALIMEMSYKTVDRILRAIHEAERQRNLSRAEQEAERAVVVEHRVDDAAQRKARQRIVSRLAACNGTGWMKRKEIKKLFNSVATTAAGLAALETLVDEGVVLQREVPVVGGRVPGTEYRLSARSN